MKSIPSVIILLVLACQVSENFGPSVDAAAATAQAVLHGKPLPGAVSPAVLVDDYVRDAPPQAQRPREVLELNQRLWGERLPNTVKSVYPAYDPTSGRVYSMSITADWMLVIDPAAKHPAEAIPFEVKGWNIGEIIVDDARRRLVWVMKDGSFVRVWDLQTRTVVADHNPSAKQGGGSRYPVIGAALDTKTGKIYTADRDRKALTIYSPDLSTNTTIPGLIGPMKAAPEGGTVYVMTGGGRGTSSIVAVDTAADTHRTLFSFSPSALGRSMPNFAPAKGGGFYLTGDTIQKVDSAGKVAWISKRIGSGAHETIDFGDTVAAVMSKPEFARDGSPYGGVALLDAKTGRIKSVVRTRFQTQTATADFAGQRLFVGNAADASLEVIDIATGKMLNTVDTGNAVEGVAIDAKTGNRYLLDRLGGSQIYRWGKDGALTALGDVPPWPFELHVDAQRRVLVAPSHFDGKLHSWDLDSGAARAPLDLGCPAGSGDTIGDLAYDDASGMGAVVFPETGCIAVFDGKKNQKVWSTVEKNLVVGSEGGPGKGLGAILDGALYVAIGENNAVLQKRDLATGRVLVETPVPRPNPPPAPWQRGLGLNSMIADPAGRRIFLAGMVLDPTTLVATKTLSDVSLVFHIDADKVLARSNDQQEMEAVLELDPRTLKVRNRWPLIHTLSMPQQLAFDPATSTVYAADLARATVAAYDWPITAPSVDAPTRKPRGGKGEKARPTAWPPRPTRQSTVR